MRIIEPSVNIIEERDAMKKIEMAGRTCYKSESAITDDSARKFYTRLTEHQHAAMLEHATFVFEVDGQTFLRCASRKYLNTSVAVATTPTSSRYLVSGNLRAINEARVFELSEALREIDPALVYIPVKQDWLHNYSVRVIDFEADVPDPTPEEIAMHRYTTMRFITDRGVTHEIVRHRPFSFAQESTRYCNYSKDKFGGGDLMFIKPANYDNWGGTASMVFVDALRDAEAAYNSLINSGATPQEARAVLPNAIKTEIIVTGNDAEWQHFFNLRSRGTTGAPHPDIKIVADQALKLYNEKYGIGGN